MINGNCLRIFGVFLTIGILACSRPASKAIEVRSYPLDSLEGVITKSGVELDTRVSSDGKGALKITAPGPVTVRLFETGDIDAEDARLIYSAKVKTEGVEGQVFLEMWCHLAGSGDYFSRGPQNPLSGTSEWSTLETLFFLPTGNNPDNVKLNLVIKGKGTAWIDEIKLIQGPLK